MSGQYIKYGFHLWHITNINVLKIMTYLNIRSHGLGFRYGIRKKFLSKVLKIPEASFHRAFNEAVSTGLLKVVEPTDAEAKRVDQDLIWVESEDLNATAWGAIPFCDLDFELMAIFDSGQPKSENTKQKQPTPFSESAIQDKTPFSEPQENSQSNQPTPFSEPPTPFSESRHILIQKSIQSEKEEAAIAASPLEKNSNAFTKEEKDQDLVCSNDMEKEISKPSLSIKVYDVNNINDIDLEDNIDNGNVIANANTKEEQDNTYKLDILLPLAKEEKDKDIPPTPLPDDTNAIDMPIDELPNNIIDIRKYIDMNIIPEIISNEYSSINEREMMLDFLVYKFGGLLSDSLSKLSLASVCTQELEKISHDVLNTVLSDQEFLEKFRLAKLQEQVTKECQADTGKGDSMTIDDKQAKKDLHRKESQAKALATITSASGFQEPDIAKLKLKQQLEDERAAKALAAKARIKAKPILDAKGLVSQCASLEEIQSKVDHYTVDLVYAYLEKEVNDKGKRIPKLTARDRGMLNNFIKNCNNENLDVLKMVKTSLEVLERKKKVLCIDELCKSWIWNEAFDLVVNTKAIPKVSELNVRYV